MSDFNLGTVTAYGYAKDKGYTGTEDEFAALMASYADVAEQAAESATQAAASATTASTKASEAAQSATAAASSKTAAETAQSGAETAAQTATTKAGEATTAATTATNKATEATTAATTATGKATEAAGSATTATTKAGEASTSATNAAASATRAQEILDSIPEDYSQLSDDVSDLKDGLTAVESDVTDLKEDLNSAIEHENKYVIGKENYLFGVTWTTGASIDASGNLLPSDNFRYSNLIEIPTGEYMFYGYAKGINTNTRIHGYDSNGDWLKQITYSSSGTNIGVNYFTFYKPNDVKYVKISTAIESRYSPEYLCASDSLVKMIDDQRSEFEKYRDNLGQYVAIYENYLDSMTPMPNTTYDVTNGNTVSNNNGKTYAPIKLKAGVTYYYKNLYAYFSWTKFNGVYSRLDNDIATNKSGSFTASADGEIGICVSPNVSGYIFTNSKDIYDGIISDDYALIDALNVKKTRTYHIEKDDSGDFTTLVAGLEEACKYMDSIVYVGDGVWDVIDELGDDYLNNVSDSQRGIVLKNRVHVIFSSKAKVVCNYTGTRSDTIKKLSVFNVGQYGFTIENANIESKNVRYCIHDDYGTNATPYTNRYINCVMKQDNSMISGATAQGFSQCIGGGLGANGNVLVSGCVFENVNPVYAEAYCPLVSYHNTAAASGRSIVEITGNYLKGRYSIIRGTWLGTSTDKTQFLVHDNSLGYAIQHRAENTSASIENTEMYEWNNVIRNS